MRRLAGRRRPSWNLAKLADQEKALADKAADVAARTR